MQQLVFYPRDPAREMPREVNQQSRDVSMASSVLPVVCSLCGYFSPTLPMQNSHHLVHSKDPSFATVCAVYSCEENFSGLNMHLYRQHREFDQQEWSTEFLLKLSEGQ